MTILASVLLLIALSQIVVGALAWAGKLPGNGVIGLRIPEVRKSEEMWVKTHRIAGPLWTLAGVALGLGAIIAFTASGWMWAVVALGVLLWLIFVGMGAGIAANAAAMMDMKANEPAEGCCSAGGQDAAAGAPAAQNAGCDSDDACASDPAADCGVSGGCGSCALNGSCEGGNDIDLGALRKAAENTDGSKR